MHACVRECVCAHVYVYVYAERERERVLHVLQMDLRCVRAIHYYALQDSRMILPVEQSHKVIKMTRGKKG